jgi:hypothetical protein
MWVAPSILVAPDFPFYHKLTAVVLRKARKHQAGRLTPRDGYPVLVVPNVGIINGRDRF